MQFNKSHDLSGIIAKKDSRAMLNAAHLDVPGARLVATDGHKLVCIPVTIDDGDTSGPVTAEAIKAAIKAAGRIGDAAIACKGSLEVANGPSFPRPSGLGQFPDVDRIAPKEGTAQIGINAEYLAAIQKAAGAEGIGLQFALNDDGSIDATSAVRVHCGGVGGVGVIAVVMPMRI
jgi:DNA polymerase III sliding clamp (beta) subunit (PCNA family)